MKVKYYYHPIAEPLIVGIVLVCTIVLSLFVSNLFVLAICFFYIITVLYSHLYIRKLSKVSWSIKQYQERLFTENSSEIKITFSNPTKIDIQNMVFTFHTEDGVGWEGIDLIKNSLSDEHYNLTVSIEREKEKTYNLQAIGLKRGSYGWKYSELILKDPFHLVSVSISSEINNIPFYRIYPNMKKVKISEIIQWRVGFRNARVSPLYDETKIIGVKQYEKEGFRSIHWGATAKSGQLVAKKFEHTQGDRFSICLNLDGKNGFMLRKDLDDLIELATGICKELIVQNCSFEIWINQQCQKGIVHLSPGRGRKQLNQSLELFASITENELPIDSKNYYKNVFRKKEAGSIPLIIGTPPDEFNRRNPWILVHG